MCGVRGFTGCDLKIVSYDELRGKWESQAQLLDASVGWFPLDFRRVEEARRLGYPAADYCGVYAVEGTEVLSSVRVLRLPYTMSDGESETVSAIQGVATKREWSRKGLARRLLEEVHRREVAAGSRFAVLWTGYSNAAHALYNSMGYVDVHTPKLAIKKCAKAKAGRFGYALKPVRKEDSALLMRLHAESTAGRIGFTPRPKDILTSVLKLGFLEPASLRLIHLKGKPVGYVQIQKGPGWIRSDEVVLTDRADPGAVVSQLESETGGGWLVLSGTFVRDVQGLLGKRGYSITDHTYSCLMARALVGKHPHLREELGTAAPSFTCQYLDHF